jgi:hypothetical protein
MKYRIVKKTGGKFGNNTVFVAQKKTAFGLSWKNLKNFYKSEFEDMPGWETEVFSDVNSAFAAIQTDKLESSSPVTRKSTIVYSE